MKKYFLILSLFTYLFMLFSCIPLSAQHYRVQNVGKDINTTSSESDAILIDDSTILYTTNKMVADTKGRMYIVDFSPVLSQIMEARINPDGSIGQGYINRWGLNKKGYNCANAVHDAVHDIIYFTLQSMGDKSYSEIYYSQRKAGRWGKPQPMGGDVNLKGYTNTHPAVGHMSDGKTILYFSSDRPGGMGGLDIWYAVILSPGMPGRCTNLGTPINTDSNEVTPFYSDAEGILYFSSNRNGGQGGYDIYKSSGARNSWQQPLNLGNELNSEYNDLFFNLFPCRCKCPADSGEIVEACGFLTSNRRGSLFETDSNCCNDIFRWSRIKQPQPAKAPAQKPPEETPLDLIPLSLYFHNDEPNPATLDTVTSVNYTACWKHYIQMRDEYKGAQASPADKRKWDSIQWAVDFFFDHEVSGSYHRLLHLCDLLNKELKAGKHITVTLDGYASPLHEGQYNLNLSKRRISSIRNLMKEWNDEALLPYLNNGSLILEMAGHGAADTDEVAPSDPLRDPKNAKSVYSIEAALDRRVDIINITYR